MEVLCKEKEMAMKNKELDEYELARLSGCYLQREVYGQLVKWKKEKARDHVACFLRGARRSGKSVLALQLAHEEYRSFIKVSFDRATDAVKELFVNGLLDLDTFYDSLMVAYDTVLHEGESLLILDEVQLWKPARQAIKTLLLDGRYDILETGSLATIVKSDEKEEKYLLPSEELTIDVHPLSFREFLLNDGQEAAVRLIESSLRSNKPFGAGYRAIYRKFREYMIVGGMPKPLRTYLLTHDFEKAEEEKRSILSLYRDDVSTQKKVNPAFALSVLDSVPSELSHHDSRFRLSHLSSSARLRDYAAPMKWLSDAGILSFAYPVEDPSPLPLLTIRPDEFKAYLLDTGLLYSLTYLSLKQDELFFKRLLLDTLHVNEGMFAENYAAQALSCCGSKVCYYVKRDERTFKTILEVDFLMLEGTKITPIEVKSSDDYSHRSLTKFKNTFQKLVNQGILLYDGDIATRDGVRYYPLFVFEWLLRS